jgi:hypothetical protein
MDSYIKEQFTNIFEKAISQDKNFSPAILTEVEDTNPKKWDLYTKTLKADKNNADQLTNDGTSKSQLYTIAGYLMATLLDKQESRFLDPFAGNCCGLRYFLQGFGESKYIKGIEISDITNFSNRVFISGSNFQLCNAASANIDRTNILLLFDVPPYPGRKLNFCNFADVKLIMRYISAKLKIIKKKSNLKFYILLLGEIGAGCNTAGIFNWLNGHPHLARIYHRYIYITEFSGFKGHREILLFRVVLDKSKASEYPLDNIKRIDLTNDPPYMVETSHLRIVTSLYLSKYLNDAIA